jgi:Uma2 family endonuclease
MYNEKQERMMPTLLHSSPEIPRIGDLLDRLGGVPAERVRYHPLPGTATEQDVLDIEAREHIHCELVDGVLVEKPVGYEESYLAGLILTAINVFVSPGKLGIVTGEAGMLRLFPGLVRGPDVAFVSLDRLPGGKIPTDPIPSLVPDLAVEILSRGNTPREMDRKRREYFDAGVRLVWIVDPVVRTVAVYLPGAEPVVLQANQTLGGEPVLEGFTIELSALFANPTR